MYVPQATQNYQIKKCKQLASALQQLSAICKLRIDNEVTICDSYLANLIMSTCSCLSFQCHWAKQSIREETILQLYFNVVIIIAVAIIVLHLLVFGIMSLFKKYFPERGADLCLSDNINIIIAATLIGTMFIVMQQTNELAKSTDQIALQSKELKNSNKLQEYNIEIQNRPYVDLSEFEYYYGKGGFNIDGIAKCYGKTPAHDFERIRDLIFYIKISKSKLEEFNKNGNKTKHFFYLKDIGDKISEYIKDNPKITKAELEEYLKKIRAKPIEVKHEAGGGFELKLDFENSYVFLRIKEWRKSLTVVPPQKTQRLNTTRVTSDLMSRIKKGEIILMYYCSYRYEGLLEGRELTSHYIGTIFKSPFSDIKPTQKVLYWDDGRRVPVFTEDKKPVLVYKFKEIKTWISRKPIPHLLNS